MVTAFSFIYASTIHWGDFSTSFVIGFLKRISTIINEIHVSIDNINGLNLSKFPSRKLLGLTICQNNSKAHPYLYNTKGSLGEHKKVSKWVNEIAYPLSLILNSLLASGIIPYIWYSNCKSCTIRQEGKSKIICNYRSVSVLPFHVIFFKNVNMIYCIRNNTDSELTIQRTWLC